MDVLMPSLAVTLQIVAITTFWTVTRLSRLPGSRWIFVGLALMLVRRLLGVYVEVFDTSSILNSGWVPVFISLCLCIGNVRLASYFIHASAAVKHWEQEINGKS